MNTHAEPFEQDPPGHGPLAGEYVLGVLDQAQRAQVQARIAHDPAFAAEVAQWEAHLAPLLEQLEPVAVPDYVWARLRAALALPEAASRPAAPAPKAAPSGFWNNLGLWRSVGIGSLATAVVAVLALVSTLRSVPPAPQPPSVAQQPAASSGMPQMVSTLAQDDGSTGYVATMDARNGRMTIMPMQPMHQDGRVPELWIIPKGGKPISMGVMDPEHPVEHVLPEPMRKLLRADALLAVTMEPPGGAPGGVATGPVVAKGAITALTLGS